MPIKLLRRVEIPTPFGKVELPEFEIPLPHERPVIDERRRRALHHAVGADIGGMIPWVGAVIEDLHAKELRKLLTREEFEIYSEEDKVAPSTIALIKTFIKKREV